MNWLVGSCGFLALSLGILSARGGVSPKEISGPNQYGFVFSTYSAEGAAPAGTVSVEWTSGNSGYCCGQVGYTTTNGGTAIPGRDYTPVSGVCYFSDPYWRTFTVPLSGAPSPVDKTVRIALFKIESNCSFWPYQYATLVIRASAPRVAITRRVDEVELSWPAVYTNYVVETATSTGLGAGQWSLITNVPLQTNGQFTLDILPDRQRRFFRLRQQP